MKYSVIIIMLFLFILGHSQTDDETFSAILQQQIDSLELSGEVKDAFIEISNKYYVKMQDIRAVEGSKISKFKAMRTLQSDKNEEMEEILTEEQFNIFKQLQKENRSKLKDRYKQGK